MNKINNVLIVILSLLGCLNSQAADNNCLVVSTQYGVPNRQMVLNIMMNNTDAIEGFQFDIKLPQGITIAKNNKNVYMATSEDRGKNHSFSIRQRSDGSYRVLAASTLSGATFTGNEGIVCSLTLDVAPSVMCTAYPLTLSNIELTTNKGVDGIKPANANFKLVITPIGDANGDFDINIADVVTIVASITGKNPTPFNAAASDIDGSGPSANWTDVKSLVNMLLK